MRHTKTVKVRYSKNFIGSFIPIHQEFTAAVKGTIVTRRIAEDFKLFPPLASSLHLMVLEAFRYRSS